MANDPTTFGEEELEAFLEALAETGRMMESVDRAGLRYMSLRKYLVSHPEFRERLEDAKARYREKIERTIEGRGIDGWNEPVFHQGSICGYVHKFSDRMLELHAKRHIPEYRDKISVDAEVRGGVLVIPSAGGADEWTKKWVEKTDDPQ